MKPIRQTFLFFAAFVFLTTSPTNWSAGAEAPGHSHLFGRRAVKLKRESPPNFQTCVLFPNGGTLTRLIGNGDKLTFSIGVKAPSTSGQVPEGEFIVRAEADGNSKTIFLKRVNPRQNKEDRGWSDWEVPLGDYVGKTVQFIFEAGLVHGEAFSKREANPNLLWGAVRVGNFGRRPEELNVILISLDTLRADHLGIAGYHRPTSPNIDALAKGGVYFSEAISVSPWTKPSHFSLLTGLLPSSHGMMTGLDALEPEKEELSENIPTLAELLQKSGYLTQAYTGSAYLAADYGYYRGFDRYQESSEMFRRDGPFVFGRSLDWIKKNARNKFFLFIHTYEIHSPFRHGHFLKELGIYHNEVSLLGGPDTHSYYLKHPDKIPVQVAKYDSGILYVDQWIGQIRKVLEDLKLADSTAVVITSDHGEELMERGYFLTHGHTLNEELLRVPLVFYAPGHFSPRVITGYQAQQTDVMPTLLDLLGIKSPGLRIEGKSLLRILKGETEAGGDIAFSESTNYGPEKKSIRWIQKGRYKLMLEPERSSLTRRTYALQKETPRQYDDSPWNTLFDQTDGKAFYNLTLDPSEKNNLTGQGEPVEKLLEKKLLSYLGSIPKARSKKKYIDTTETNQELMERLRSLGY